MPLWVGDHHHHSRPHFISTKINDRVLCSILSAVPCSHNANKTVPSFHDLGFSSVRSAFKSVFRAPTLSPGIPFDFVLLCTSRQVLANTPLFSAMWPTNHHHRFLRPSSHRPSTNLTLDSEQSLVISVLSLSFSACSLNLLLCLYCLSSVCFYTHLLVFWFVQYFAVGQLDNPTQSFHTPSNRPPPQLSPNTSHSTHNDTLLSLFTSLASSSRSLSFFSAPFTWSGSSSRPAHSIYST
jgi:hypothetical protein